MIHKEYVPLATSEDPTFDLESVNLDGGDHLVVVAAEDPSGASEYSEPAVYSQEYPEYIIKKTTLNAIADSVRSKTGKTGLIPPQDLPAEIRSITTGITPTGTKPITSNGTGIDVTNYAKVDVNVPIPTGYVRPTGTKPITSNGTGIDVTNYAKVDVNVPTDIPAMPIYGTYKLRDVLDFSMIPSVWYDYTHYIFCQIAGEMYVSFCLSDSNVTAINYSTLEPVTLYDESGWKKESYKRINFPDIVARAAVTTLFSNWIEANVEGASGGDEPGGDSGGDNPVEENSTITYELNDDGVSYGAMGASDARTAVISATYDGLPVTRIYMGAFSAMEYLTAVTIPASVIIIDNHAFSYSTSLTSITFEGTMEQWNAITFKGGDWNADVPATEVVCSDGTISLV